MGNKCYRVNCDCIYPGHYTEFDTMGEAEDHIRDAHNDGYNVYIIVPVDTETCKHPRHDESRKVMEDILNG